MAPWRLSGSVFIVVGRLIMAIEAASDPEGCAFPLSRHITQAFMRCSLLCCIPEVLPQETYCIYLHIWDLGFFSCNPWAVAWERMSEVDDWNMGLSIISFSPSFSWWEEHGLLESAMPWNVCLPCILLHSDSAQQKGNRWWERQKNLRFLGPPSHILCGLWLLSETWNSG